MTEGVWSSRYRYVDELKRMGARIQVDDKTAVVEGVEKLCDFIKKFDKENA